ncbi:hypothetical protein [Sphingomonas immobilis]|uniref:Uncharacterized protein n=1 Tax=Sphingomonas immobilis TaxID=3063997 RepID=A0ABT8ZT07_9SPHN|nr:hypothetical protein [Sphingomonas sp. CA1-15]MDO7840702.1 hypothetical protein [Sphingomonas sp. CA1-15]
MSFLKFAALPLALIAAPVAAQSLTDTHTQRWNQAGKLPIVTHHQIRGNGCTTNAAPMHLSGKSQYAPHAKQDCSADFAKAKTAKVEVAGN